MHCALGCAVLLPSCCASLHACRLQVQQACTAWGGAACLIPSWLQRFALGEWQLVHASGVSSSCLQVDAAPLMALRTACSPQMQQPCMLAICSRRVFSLSAAPRRQCPTGCAAPWAHCSAFAPMQRTCMLEDRSKHVPRLSDAGGCSGASAATHYLRNASSRHAASCLHSWGGGRDLSGHGCAGADPRLEAALAGYAGQGGLQATCLLDSTFGYTTCLSADSAD